jgi:pimeloyl-ACP methyl ester carboxylesterase
MRLALVTLALTLAGCGASADHLQADASPKPSADAGNSALDAAAMLADAGAMPLDASNAVLDASPGEADAASEPDAGEAGPDATVAEPGPDASVAPLTWKACSTTDWPDEYPKPAVGVLCTTVTVPKVWSDPSKGTVDLRVARHKSKTFPTNKAVFHLAGGPGGSAVWQSGMMPYYLPKLRDQFDFIYLDQRGTGGSGYLDCSKGYPDTQAQWEACAKEHTQDDLNDDLTLDAAHDVDAVRERMGYAKIAIRGGSYGTRVGLEYLRQFEANATAIVLDGIAPPDFQYFPSVITQFDDGVARLVSDCTADPACLAVSPNLEDDLEKRRAQLAATPRPILVDGSPDIEDEGLYLEVLQAAIDWTVTRYQVPNSIHQAMTGDNNAWNTLMTNLFGVTITDDTSGSGGGIRARHALHPIRASRPDWLGLSYVAPALFETVVCAEWLPNTAIADMQTLQAQQKWGDGAEIGIAKACASWAVNPIDASLRQAVSSQSSKVLLMSGDIDIRTPVSVGEQAKKTLPNATHIDVPFASHGTIEQPCAASIMSQFIIADGDITAVDQSCLAAMIQPAW